MHGYPVPAKEHRVETIVRRSRFVCTLSPAPESGQAQSFVRRLRDEFPDATHTCWAFVAGPPASTAHIGMSDDGEPHGSAGRPILHALLHSGIGEIAAVVTRYFGGAKLGTGGLSRAYSEATAAALESLPHILRIPLVPIKILAPFHSMEPIFRLVDAVGGVGREEVYGEGLELRVSIPPSQAAYVRGKVAEVTSGEGRVEDLST